MPAASVDPHGPDPRPLRRRGRRLLPVGESGAHRSWRLQRAEPGRRPPPPRRPASPLVVDTDMAPDDVTAIASLLRDPAVDLKAITVVGTGEAHCPGGMFVARAIVTMLRETPVPVDLRQRLAAGGRGGVPCRMACRGGRRERSRPRSHRRSRRIPAPAHGAACGARGRRGRRRRPADDPDARDDDQHRDRAGGRSRPGLEGPARLHARRCPRARQRHDAARRPDRRVERPRRSHRRQACPRGRLRLDPRSA